MNIFFLDNYDCPQYKLKGMTLIEFKGDTFLLNRLSLIEIT